MMTGSQVRLWSAARRYHAAGYSLIPCNADKRPTGNWREFMVRKASLSEVEKWYCDLGIHSIGLIGGAISRNVVFIDLDGIPAIKKFAGAFPQLCENTRSILTGSLKGIHLYVRVDEIPDNINVRVDGIGGFEIRGNGQYVIAPPSPHPSGNNYRVYRDHDILHLPHIHNVREWMNNLRLNARENQNEILQQHATPQSVSVDASKRAFLQKVVSEELARVETASEGNRNKSLFYAGLRLANLAAGGELNWNDMSQRLYQSACTVHQPHEYKSIERTIASAWRIGSQRPRTIS